MPSRLAKLARTLLPLIALTPLTASAVPANTDPWDAAFNFEYNAASASFEQLHAAAPQDSRLALARAATLLARQPRTASNIAAARALVAGLLAAPAAPIPPEHHALALFLLARVDHDHLSAPDLESARATYAELRRAHPAHPLADQAAVHLALILLHQSPASTAAEQQAALETFLAEVTAPSARRELLFLAGRFHWLLREDPAAALPLFIAGRALGYESPARNGELDLLIADLATEVGQPELAARHFAAFVAAYPRDPRAPTARRLAADLDAQP